MAGWIFLAVVSFWLWYMAAADYGYAAVSGTYVLERKGETSMLVLRKDGTFRQELRHAARVERAQGTWHRFGESGIEFSRDFLRVQGQEVREDGKAYAQVTKKFLGLIPAITLDPEAGGPIFRRKLLQLG